ncbi:hypothetical protein A6E15_05550 [Natrinema saccharevitans]|uniref:Uncharacterized protein n=1 Tax=Natrinema saccharevitans TaxID=301967 RepID=A0A1S8AUZ2_9EURY|nr:hypothetical protein [Natrinema saccharevitans]OLZ40485.1 hypothetical protein A6E15_05550 [Natrinema saccharevitans]
MRRRDYVMAVGSSVGGLGMGTRTQSISLERGCPVGDATTVRPGQDVVFEAAATPGVEPTTAEWTVDGPGAADLAPAAPFWSYTYRTGNPAAHGRFEESGIYEVSVTADGATLSWQVTVTDDAPPAPSVEVTCEPGPDATVTPNESIEVTATAADDHGNFHRLVWQEGRNATYLERVDLSGSTATVTYATTGGDAIWFVGGYPMIAWVVCRDGRTRAVRTDGPSVEALRDVSITGTNDPVHAGEDLVVDAEVAVEGDSTYHAFVEATVELIVGHDPTRVDSETVEVFAGESEPVSLEFTTATVRNTQTFPARLETRHAAAETDVTVIGTEDDGQGHLAVTGLETNAPVTGGDRLEVTVTLANTGEGPASREVELVVGHDPTTVDSRSVTVGAGETTAVTMGYDTYPVENDDEFPVRVRTGDDSASRSVLVSGRDGGDGGDEAQFAVSITGTKAPVSGGDFLAVTATVENVGGTAGSGDVELVVGHSPTVVDTRRVGLEPGETATVRLGYDTYPVANDDTFPVSVRSPHTSDTRTVTVYGTD